LRNQLCKSVAVDKFSTLQIKPDESNLANLSLLTKDSLNKRSVFESLDFRKQIGLSKMSGDKINNYIVNMDSAVSHYKSKLMLENIKNIRLNNQSDVNLSVDIQASNFKTSSYKKNHLKNLEKEDTINEVLDDLSTKLFSNTRVIHLDNS
jgi:hypothetical protein